MSIYYKTSIDIEFYVEGLGSHVFLLGYYKPEGFNDEYNIEYVLGSYFSNATGVLGIRKTMENMIRYTFIKNPREDLSKRLFNHYAAYTGSTGRSSLPK
jgi:hypothetical protein